VGTAPVPQRDASEGETDVSKRGRTKERRPIANKDKRHQGWIWKGNHQMAMLSGSLREARLEGGKKIKEAERKIRRTF